MIEVVGALSKESSLFQNYVDVVFYVSLRYGHVKPKGALIHGNVKDDMPRCPCTNDKSS